MAKRPGDEVLGGGLNLDGELVVRVSAPVAEGSLARLIEMVRVARSTKGRYQRLADRVSGWFLQGVLVVAGGAFAFHCWQTGIDTALMAALAVLLIACPCAWGWPRRWPYGRRWGTPPGTACCFATASHSNGSRKSARCALTKPARLRPANLASTTSHLPTARNRSRWAVAPAGSPRPRPTSIRRPLPAIWHHRWTLLRAVRPTISRRRRGRESRPAAATSPNGPVWEAFAGWKRLAWSLRQTCSERLRWLGAAANRCRRSVGKAEFAECSYSRKPCAARPRRRWLAARHSTATWGY